MCQGVEKGRNPGVWSREKGPAELTAAFPGVVGCDVGDIPREVYHVMHLPGSADLDGCGPCEGGVQEFEFHDRAAGVVIS